MGEFDQTIGFTLMGVLINTYLTGIIMAQFFTYWTSKDQDHWGTRSLVAFLFIINAAQAAAVIYMSCNFANPNVVAMTAVLALVNQAFQSWRIYAFTKSKVIIGFIVVIALATCGMGIAAAVQSWIFSELAKLKALQPVVEANLALQSALDVAIAIILSVSLSKSKTKFPKTDKVLSRLMRTAVQSGSFTAVFALGSLLSFRYSPDTYMIALFALPIGRIYTHTLMDHFNSREELRGILSNGGNVISVPNFNVPKSTAGMQTMRLGSASASSKDPEETTKGFGTTL
ncbi:hypothetical protein B0H11DRAFT_1948653 [Mycena galericulata]|nr:hypothetical protein B0H11DRAFT_1948653 [Mycena galericulata]